jgi:hypothetical protein
MDYEEILNRRSYKNIVLLNASIPSYDTDTDKDEREEEERKEKFVPRHANEIFDQLL